VPLCLSEVVLTILTQAYIWTGEKVNCQLQRRQIWSVAGKCNDLCIKERTENSQNTDLGDQGICEGIILKQVLLKLLCEVVDWINLAYCKVQWWAVFERCNNLRGLRFSRWWSCRVGLQLFLAGGCMYPRYADICLRVHRAPWLSTKFTWCSLFRLRLHRRGTSWPSEKQLASQERLFHAVGCNTSVTDDSLSSNWLSGSN
jgi:hypothetical protein